jgi:hypothetical protein
MAIAGTVWTKQEIDLIVADYFSMLQLELAHQPYVKAEHNAALQQFTGRSRRSIESKHQNISAVLQNHLGMRWIEGYKPLAHYQTALLEGIERYLSAKGEPVPLEPTELELADNGVLFSGAAPRLEPKENNLPGALKRLVKKFDPAARDERNRKLGLRGEERVFHSEKSRLSLAGRADLAKEVRWISKEEGDGAGYDIRSFTESGEERWLEVKTTNGSERTPFYLSQNEHAVSLEQPAQFRIFRLYDFARVPKAFQIAPPLDTSLILETANYRASFN